MKGVPLLDSTTSQLTSGRAFAWFAAALLVGATAIWRGWLSPIGPSIPVVLYGLLLVYAQQRFFTELNTTLKDSPYFLGFLLTLGALVKIFWTLQPETPPAPGAAVARSLVVGQVVSEAGAALLATISGLFMRQMTHSLDPGETSRDEVFRALSQDIRNQAYELHKTQGRFAQLVQEFVDARERQFSREEQAFQRYVDGLERGSVLLEQIQGEFPGRFGELLTSIGSIQEDFENTRAAVVSDIEQFREAVSRSIHETSAHYSQGLRALTETAKKAEENLGSAIGELLKGLQAAREEIAQEVEAAAAAVERTQIATAQFTDAARETAAEAERSAGSLEALHARAKEAGDGLVRDLAEAGATLRTNLRTQLEAVSQDVAAIDQILTDLAGLLGRRLEREDSGL